MKPSGRGRERNVLSGTQGGAGTWGKGERQMKRPGRGESGGGGGGSTWRGVGASGVSPGGAAWAWQLRLRFQHPEISHAGVRS